MFIQFLLLHTNTIIMSKLIDAFKDVTDSEKTFIKIWNKFMRSSTIAVDMKVPSKCLEFIRSHASKIGEENLRNEVTLHLLNLWDNKLISQYHVVFCTREMDRLLNDSSVRAASRREPLLSRHEAPSSPRQRILKRAREAHRARKNTGPGTCASIVLASLKKKYNA